jgi:hypothetical protein
MFGREEETLAGTSVKDFSDIVEHEGLTLIGT